MWMIIKVRNSLNKENKLVDSDVDLIFPNPSQKHNRRRIHFGIENSPPPTHTFILHSLTKKRLEINQVLFKTQPLALGERR